MKAPRVLHLALEPESMTVRSTIQLALCGARVPTEDVVGLDDATCVRCLELEQTEAAEQAHAQDGTRPDWSLAARVTRLETLTVDLARECAALRQLIAQLEEGTAELFDALDRGVAWRERS